MRSQLILFMSQIPWDKFHAGITHFPIALLLFATVCDFVSVAFKSLSFARELRLVSFYGLTAAALSSLGAVVSGIALTNGELGDRGDLLPTSQIHLAHSGSTRADTVCTRRHL
jgi:uncharacterized membrane protein